MIVSSQLIHLVLRIISILTIVYFWYCIRLGKSVESVKLGARNTIRAKIVDIYLNNYLLLKRGQECDEWGSNWRVKSFNDVISFFKNETQNYNMNLFAKFGTIVLQISSLVDNLDNPTIYDAYNVIHRIYFDALPSPEEFSELKNEFEKEKMKRGIPHDM